MIIYLPLAVCLTGGVIFLLTKDADRKALAKDMWWTGLLITLAQVAGEKLGHL